MLPSEAYIIVDCLLIVIWLNREASEDSHCVKAAKEEIMQLSQLFS